MSLETPEKIRSLQRKLYVKAKAEPEFRFYLLYDKVYREDILEHAYKLAKANRGAPGVDGVTFAQIEEAGVQEWLSGLRQDLCEKRYKPQPVRRVTIPKPGGGERPLGIPTIRDRVVQTAVKLVIEPVLEADLSPYTFGYRPKKSALDAIKVVQGMLNQGYTDVVDADLSKYFDTIPHSGLLKSIAIRISDRNILRLIKMWLKAPVEERDENGGTRLTGGKTAKKGTPQGGVISPLLANRYINRFLKYWAKTEQPRHLRARIVSYADDFVILSRGRAAEALDWTRNAITRLGLTLNEAKTRLKDAAGTVRVLRLQLRSAPALAGWQTVSGGEPVAEERRPAQETRSRPSASVPLPALAGDPGRSERDLARLGRLLLLRNPLENTPGARLPRRAKRAEFPRPAAQSAIARHSSFQLRSDFRRAGRSKPSRE
jgi:RNA-directed DNA polymerase